MRIYRVHYRAKDGTCQGFTWTPNLKEANGYARRWRSEEEGEAEILRHDFTRTMEGVLQMLRKFASHPDNG